MKILMQLKNNFSNSRGFSLAEVLVAAGLFGGLSLAIMHFMQTSTQSTNTVMASMEVSQLHNQVLLHLRDENNCRQTFGGSIFGQDNIQLSRATSDGDKDATFKGLTGDHAPVKLTGIKLYHPVNEKPPGVANIDSTFPTPDQDGWTVIVEFKYEKYKSSGNAKIFGGNTVSKFQILKFNNFMVDEMVTNPANCTSTTYNIVGKGREYELDDGTILFIAPCLKGDPGNAIQSCVI